MSDGSAILLLSAASTIVGAALSAVVSRFFYLKAGSDLDAALRSLKGNHQMQIQALTAIGRMLEQSGMGKPIYDAAGNLTGVTISITVSPGPLASSANLGTPKVTTTIGVPPQYDRQHEQPPSHEPEGHHA